MLRFRILMIVLAVLHYVINADGKCISNQKEFYGQFISNIKVNHSNDIRLIWSAVENTNNITIKYDNKIIMVSSMKDNDLLLDFTYRKPTVTTTTTIPTTTTTPNRTSKHQKTIISVLVDITYWFRKRRSVSIIPNDEDECSDPTIHITVPQKYTNQLCVNKEKCFPIKCPLSFLLSDSKYSDIPASNTILFSDKYCTLKKPELWDEWIKYYFKVEGNKTDEYIFDDPDKDGLVNLLEYYGDNNVFNTTTEELIRQKTVSDVGTNPNNADTDGDMLLDGFEFNYKMNPKVKDSISVDTDGDGLTNLDEQIRKTNPLKKDTDNDGVDDGEEVKLKTDPLDPSDHGMRDTTLDTATVRLTIGDHSGSHSERYVIRVGEIEHQSPGFGLVGSKTYVFKPGKYTITIKHVGSIYSRPDYDYRAEVVKIGGNATVSVNDPQRLLGYHSESSWDFTIGKSAELTVTMNCPLSVKRSVEKKCGCLKSCEDCEKNSGCYWDNTLCRKETWSNPWTKIEFTCPCKKCSNWYKKEKSSDMTWLSDLNKNFKCPCRVTINNDIITEVDNPSKVTWLQDKSCNPKESGNCKKYHRGAIGCIRSKAKSKHGAAQQCCYDRSGGVLKAGTAGAGTPDKYYASSFSGSMVGHYWSDVRPYNWCCLECGRKKECDYYVNELRKGNTDHCK